MSGLRKVSAASAKAWLSKDKGSHPHSESQLEMPTHRPHPAVRLPYLKPRKFRPGVAGTGGWKQQRRIRSKIEQDKDGPDRLPCPGWWREIDKRQPGEIEPWTGWGERRKKRGRGGSRQHQDLHHSHIPRIHMDCTQGQCRRARPPTLYQQQEGLPLATPRSTRRRCHQTPGGPART